MDLLLDTHDVQRIRRIWQLSTDAATFKLLMKADVEEATKQNQKALELLNTVAKNAGFSSLDDYREDAIRHISCEESGALASMYLSTKGLDEDTIRSYEVLGGLVACRIMSQSHRIATPEFHTAQSVLFGTKALVRSIYYTLFEPKADADVVAKLMNFSHTTLGTLKGGLISREALESMKYLKVWEGILLAIGALLDAAHIIVEILKHPQNRSEKLQQAIKELCAHRFAAKKIRQHAKQVLDFQRDTKSLIAVFANAKPPKEQPSEESEFGKECDELQRQLNETMNELVPTQIWDMLVAHDEASKGAWTEDDPDLEWVLKWIEAQSAEK